MRIKRLKKLVDFLHKKADELYGTKFFNFSSWAEKGWQNKTCGTTACAMGWATAAFPRSRLYLSGNSWSNGLELTYENINGYHTGFNAASEFFDIEPFVSEILFNPEYYSRSRQTGRRAINELARRVNILESEGVKGLYNYMLGYTRRIRKYWLAEEIDWQLEKMKEEKVLQPESQGLALSPL